MSRVVCAVALLALSAGALEAQVLPKSFSVTTRIGAMSPERSASRDVAGLIGLDTEYSFTRWAGVGAALDVSRGNTRREDFVARLRYGNAAVGGGDTIYYQYLSQPVNTINVGAYGVLRLPNERISPFVMAGVGTYTMLLDAQVSGTAQRKVEMSYTFGGGAWLRLTESTGIQLDVRALQMQKYDRTFLDSSKGRSPNTVFPEDFPAVPAAKNTALNTVFTLGFRYIPGGVN
jgi:opacity protein-like surface antigen